MRQTTPPVQPFCFCLFFLRFVDTSVWTWTADVHLYVDTVLLVVCVKTRKQDTSFMTARRLEPLNHTPTVCEYVCINVKVILVSESNICILQQEITSVIHLNRTE